MPTARRKFSYVGSKELSERTWSPSQRCCIGSKNDAYQWVNAQAKRLNSVTATFIIDLDEQLWVADRHSEHVACAVGRDVLAAGEMQFSNDKGEVYISTVTNQSTGYCPEPDCWQVVDELLHRLGIPHPSAFTATFVFRRCKSCGITNIIKDGVFECAVCNSALSPQWNYG